MNSSNETRFKDEKSTGYVFISYSSKNQQMADSVRLMLKENRIPCWMAPYDIPAGHRYAYVINEALENCSCLLLLLTNASQNSQFVEREVERAITYRKPILPMQLEDLELNSGFKFYIGNSQIVAVPNISADAPEFLRILTGIKNILNIHSHSEAETTTGIRANDIKSSQVLPYSFQKIITDSEIAALLSKKMAAGVRHFLAVCEDGHVVALGDNKERACDVSEWKDIIKVDAGDFHSVGLRANGTVYCTHPKIFKYGQDNVSSWYNIVDIGAGSSHTVGLKADGTVVAVGSNSEGQCNVKDWSGIVAISVDGRKTIGIKEDGTVICTGEPNELQTDLKEWNNITQVVSGYSFCIGLDRNGNVIASNHHGKEYHGTCELEEFSNILMISCDDFYTVGLRKDGTVLSTKYQENNHIVDDRYDCDTSTWSNIIAIAIGGHNIYGLKADGTLKAVGINTYGECEVSNLKLFSDAQSFVQSLNEQKTMLENMRGKSNSD